MNLFSKASIVLLIMTLFSSVLFSQGWESYGFVPFNTDHSNGFGFEGKAYVIEGNYTNNPTNRNRLWEYDPIEDSWTHLKDFDGPARTIAIGDEWDGKYYIGFGNGLASTKLTDLWVFDPTDLSFTELPSCPCIGRSHPALIAHNDKIFMGSGSGPNGDLEDWWEYDMITQEWTKKEDIPGPDRHHPFFFGVGDNVYVGGGHERNWVKWDLETEEWTDIDDLPQGRVAGTQLEYKGKGYIVAGDTETHGILPIEETFMCYDPITGEWEHLPQLPLGSRWAPSSFIIEDDLYFFGGVAHGNELGTAMWKFNMNQLACLPAVNMNAFNITENSADLSWLATSFSISDTLKYRLQGTQEWTNILNPQAVFTLDNLEECTTYEFSIYSQCDTLLSYSTNFEFRTKGCGVCIDTEYCSSPNIIGGTDYINAIGINDYENVSGNNGGFASFVLDPSEDIIIGEEFDLYFDPGSDFALIDLNFSVWLDVNANGEFESSERIFARPNVQAPINTNILIPEDAAAGPTRLRFTLIYQDIGEACGNDNYGEVEDYCINLRMPSSNKNLELVNEVSVSPNPFVESFNFIAENNSDFFELAIVDLRGTTVYTERNIKSGSTLELSHLPSGVYFLQSTNSEGEKSMNKIIKQ